MTSQPPNSPEPTDKPIGKPLKQNVRQPVRAERMQQSLDLFEAANDADQNHAQHGVALGERAVTAHLVAARRLSRQMRKLSTRSNRHHLTGRKICRLLIAALDAQAAEDARHEDDRIHQGSQRRHSA